MPRWGLTDELVNARPWNLPEKLLRPSKTNTDPIHEAVYLTELERAIVDAPAFQRLRRVRQLGTTHLIYPGAVHTRFQHCLGAVRVVQDLFDGVLENPRSTELGDDLVHEWRRDRRNEFSKLVAESMVLARLGALLHDFSHVPFGHTIEDDYKLLKPHDSNRDRFEYFWSTLPLDTNQVLSGELKEQLELIVLSKEQRGGQGQPPLIEAKYPFVLDLVGNTICADLIDYLWRDYYFTGLPGRLGQRFFSYFFITNSHQPDDRGQHMALRIEKKGHLRADVISEVLKYLRYRYELSERALQHHAKVAADTMVAEAVDLWITAVGQRTAEGALRKLGDDGLLESMADSRYDGVRELAAGVLNRRLYKEHRRSSRDETFARQDDLYKKWSDRQFRRAFLDRMARYLQLQHPWDVLISIPNPSMRLKAADVLVAWGSVVTPLAQWDSQHGHRAAELATSHKRLWSVQLFVSPSLSDEQRDRAAAYVARELRIEWDEQQLYHERDNVREQAISELARKYPITDAHKTALRGVVYRAPAGDNADLEEETFETLVDQLEAALPPPVTNPRETTTGKPAPGAGLEKSERDRRPKGPAAGTGKAEQQEDLLNDR